MCYRPRAHRQGEGGRMTRTPEVQLLSYCGKPNQSAPANPMPVVVEVLLRPPEFLTVAFVLMHGGTERFEFAVASAKVAEAVLENGHPDINGGSPIRKHPRFMRAEVRS